MGKWFKIWRKFIWILSALIVLTANYTIAQAELSDEKIKVFVVSDASDRTLKEAPVVWAVKQLQNALQKKDLDPKILYNLSGIEEPAMRIIITPGESELAVVMAEQTNTSIPKKSESLAIMKGKIDNQNALVITGSDVRGLVYGILELADRIMYCDNPVAMLKAIENSAEQPANSIRSMTRLFVSDIEDKSWFYDKAFWESYLSMLMTNRFNRFSLTLGLGYDSPIEVTDSYFIFAYPYLVSVPGYDVKVKELPAGEREKNLEILQFISSEAARRGLYFQLGLWGHAYECENSPDVNYTIEGLNDDIHAEYCRNAVRTLLQACPDIDGITFRAHYESGIPDGSKSFWETVFQGVAECGRRVEIDLHAKGISYNQIDMALETGQPVVVSPKLTAEHMGLPAHQAAIREMERIVPPDHPNPRNKIARYGYSDFLSDNRDYGILYRIWPGKQKIFLWGDPALASGYGRHAGFCGSQGLEVCEPLSFKGRQGSGVSSERRIYKDDSLIPEGGNWQKYLYTYRIWGRHLYNPDVDPESYRRYLRYEFGEAALPVEEAIANASRVLPLVTSSHLPAGSAMTYWPEMYTNMPITNSGLPHPYGDTPSPKVFGRVSPLDPVMFSAVNEFVDDYVEDKPTARYSPLDVAGWLENFATTSNEQLEKARQVVADVNAPSFRRMYVDASAQNALGMFFADKLRAATAFMIYEKNGDTDKLNDAVFFYRKARDFWQKLIEITEDVYVEDLGFGDPVNRPHLIGHWKDRLPAIDADLNIMEELLKNKMGEPLSFQKSPSPASRDWLKPRPQMPPCVHEVPEKFYPGKTLEIKLNSESPQIETIKVHYRHVNQAEEYNIEPMSKENGSWRLNIPASFTDSEYHVIYFFEIIDSNNNAWIFPGFNDNLANQPYYHVLRDK
jgi:hypothetical protein